MKGCKPLTETEIDLIINDLKRARDRALFLLMLYTGFRIKEALSLKLSDIQEGRVKVLKRNMKRKYESRSIALHPKVIKAIQILTLEYDLKPQDYIFRSQKGDNQPLSRVQSWRILKRCVKNNNMSNNIALHSTRKTFAQRAYDAFDHDLIKTSKALGHKSILSTASYLSFDTKELDNFISSLD